MKHILLFVLMIFLISSCTFDNENTIGSKSGDKSVERTAVSVGGEVGDNAPDFTASSLGGKQLSFYNDFKGKKPAYLIFWATW